VRTALPLPFTNSVEQVPAAQQLHDYVDHALRLKCVHYFDDIWLIEETHTNTHISNEHRQTTSKRMVEIRRKSGY
jgi:hypothetical protein